MNNLLDWSSNRIVMTTKSEIKFSPVNLEERKKLDIRSGDTICVTQKITEKDKKTAKLKVRLQTFEGLCLAVKHGKEAGATFTLRKTTSGVGVERIFPLYSPVIEKIEVIKRARVRRAKLYHIRKKAAKEIRRQMRNIRDLPPLPEEVGEPTESVGSEAEPEVTEEAKVVKTK